MVQCINVSGFLWPVTKKKLQYQKNTALPTVRKAGLINRPFSTSFLGPQTSLGASRQLTDEGRRKEEAFSPDFLEKGFLGVLRVSRVGSKGPLGN